MGADCRASSLQATMTGPNLTLHWFAQPGRSGLEREDPFDKLRAGNASRSRARSGMPRWSSGPV